MEKTVAHELPDFYNKGTCHNNKPWSDSGAAIFPSDKIAITYALIRFCLQSGMSVQVNIYRNLSILFRALGL
jgi:hypothetical protein